jgi:hypothetical protein
VSFAAINLCVASQRVFIVEDYILLWTQYGNFWIHLHTDVSVRFKIAEVECLTDVTCILRQQSSPTCD